MRRLVSLLCLLPLAACMTDDLATSTTADQPLVGVDGSTDAADRGCNVILRSLERQENFDGTGTLKTNGTSWVWSGALEISTAAAVDGLAPQVMWAPAGAHTWQVATGVPVTDGSATPGYAKYTVTIDHAAAGPSNTNAFVVAAYLPMTGGGRLFDHNRNPGDFDNYQLASPDFAIWDAQGTCKPPTSTQQATLAFTADFTQTRRGVLAAGGSLVVHYDSQRLAQCSDTQGGHVRWGITAWVKFDSGQLISANVLETDAKFSIPTDGARSVALWFEATSATGCHAYDSNLNANYVFALATPPPWIGNATNLITRDSDDPCRGGAPATSAFAYDTWARQRAVKTNLCFQVYQPGETDRDNPTLWQDLDTKLRYRFIGQNGSATDWLTTPVSFDSRQGNNAQYALTWRALDPFRDYHCPEIAPVAEASGGNPMVTIKLEYVVVVNGGQYPVTGGAQPPFTGTFADYPTNPWRTANCH